MEQTAVDWLMEEWPALKYQLPTWLIEQALAMEKEQIVDAFYEGMQSSMFDPNKGRALMYYSETYNK